MSLLGSAKAATRERQAERHDLPEVTIGKDVLELVSSAMYIDPMTVYREYIQNAADAVEAAREAGSLPPGQLGQVQISVDPSARTVRIRDNGTGVPFPDFGRKLTAVGGSAKRGTSARGFRGVGRLAGLGYAQELIFRSRVSGESTVSQLRWDCRKLKAALRDPEDDQGVADLIRSVTSLERIDVEDAPDRFFEVELKGVVRLKSDRLMSPAAIADYLAQVAPVPFSPAFRLGEKINRALADHVDAGVLDVRVSGIGEPIYRQYRDSFSLDGAQSINFHDISIIEVPGIDGGIAAVAWVAHHEYEGAIPTATSVKGIRLRSGNIQVGDHTLLEELFPEPRFNVWSVGEVQIVDRRIVPNGRRDHFEQNAHFHNLINHLAPVARDITRRCRTSSIRRKWDREFELLCVNAEEELAILGQGSVSAPERDRVAVRVEQTLLKMTKVAGMEVLADERDALTERTNKFRSRLSQLMEDQSTITSPLTTMPEGRRRAYEHLFELVYECSTNRPAAKALIDRIMLRLSSET